MDSGLQPRARPLLDAHPTRFSEHRFRHRRPSLACFRLHAPRGADTITDCRDGWDSPSLTGGSPTPCWEAETHGCPHCRRRGAWRRKTWQLQTLRADAEHSQVGTERKNAAPDTRGASPAHRPPPVRAQSPQGQVLVGSQSSLGSGAAGDWLPRTPSPGSAESRGPRPLPVGRSVARTHRVQGSALLANWVARSKGAPPGPGGGRWKPVHQGLLLDGATVAPGQ